MATAKEHRPEGTVCPSSSGCCPPGPSLAGAPPQSAGPHPGPGAGSRRGQRPGAGEGAGEGFRWGAKGPRAVRGDGGAAGSWGRSGAGGPAMARPGGPPRARAPTAAPRAEPAGQQPPPDGRQPARSPTGHLREGGLPRLCLGGRREGGAPCPPRPRGVRGCLRPSALRGRGAAAGLPRRLWLSRTPMPAGRTPHATSAHETPPSLKLLTIVGWEGTPEEIPWSVQRPKPPLSPAGRPRSPLLLTHRSRFPKGSRAAPTLSMCWCSSASASPSLLPKTGRCLPSSTSPSRPGHQRCGRAPNELFGNRCCSQRGKGEGKASLLILKALLLIFWVHCRVLAASAPPTQLGVSKLSSPQRVFHSHAQLRADGTYLKLSSATALKLSVRLAVCLRNLFYGLVNAIKSVPF